MTPRTAPTEPQPTLFDRPAGLLRMTSPLGRIELVSDGAVITGLTLEHDARLPRDGFRESSLDVLVVAAEQLTEYFDGRRRRFTLPVVVEGTPFQRRVWAALAAVPFGSVTTYGAIGQAAGVGRAGRAVGAAVRANPAPLLIPCHRVLSSDRRIVGYSQGSGVPTKQWLLDHERIAYR
ncbi:methylated-DNA-[protein]-cysteine S-methyltransferase [Mycetocola sp. CAN_C7]|uniref:methylated-DNA--[protein]-cysteine S-methyltransferase n=1 Tax=Mycetocola sp. CAN_C7 TaxID=2787724 RepID=UPI001A3439C0